MGQSSPAVETAGGAKPKARVEVLGASGQRVLTRNLAPVQLVALHFVLNIDGTCSNETNRTGNPRFFLLNSKGSTFGRDPSLQPGIRIASFR